MPDRFLFSHADEGALVVCECIVDYGECQVLGFKNIISGRVDFWCSGEDFRFRLAELLDHSPTELLDHVKKRVFIVMDSVSLQALHIPEESFGDESEYYAPIEIDIARSIQNALLQYGYEVSTIQEGRKGVIEEPILEVSNPPFPYAKAA